MTPRKRGRGDSRPQAEPGWLRLEPGDEIIVRVPGKGRFRTRIVERLDERTSDGGIERQPEDPKVEAPEPKPKKKRKRKRRSIDLLDRRLPGSFGSGKRR